MKTWWIFQKDVREGIRNVQMLLALVVPIGLAVLYNAIYPDTTALPKVTVAYSMKGTSDLPRVIRAMTKQQADVTFKRQPTPRAVHDLVAREKADVGLVLTAGFDRALATGKQPQLRVIVQKGSSTSGPYVTASLEPALREMAGQSAPAIVRLQTLPAKQGTFSAVVTEVGLRPFMVVIAIIIFVGMISLYTLPTLLTEEAEKRTLDALALIASYRDVIGGKALIGLMYAAIGVPLILVLTRIMPVNLPLFALAIALFSLSMVGVGLLIGGLLKTMAQVNTWSSFLLLPFIFAAILVTVPLPRAADILLTLMPSSQALRLAINGLGGQEYYGNWLLSLLVVTAWGVAAYGLLWWRLQRREV